MHKSRRELQAWARKTLPLYDYVDITIDSCDDGMYRCSAPLSPRNLNHNEAMHAAVIWALAELAGWLAMIAEGLHEENVAAVRRVSIDFKRQANSAVSAEVEFTDEDIADVLEVIEEEGHCDVDVLSLVRDAEGRVVAEATCSYSLRAKQRA